MKLTIQTHRTVCPNRKNTQALGRSHTVSVDGFYTIAAGNRFDLDREELVHIYIWHFREMNSPQSLVPMVTCRKKERTVEWTLRFCYESPVIELFHIFFIFLSVLDEFAGSTRVEFLFFILKNGKWDAAWLTGIDMFGWLFQCATTTADHLSSRVLWETLMWLTEEDAGPVVRVFRRCFLFSVRCLPSSEKKYETLISKPASFSHVEANLCAHPHLHPSAFDA